MAPRKPTPHLKAFGAEIARLRNEAGLTRTDLAKLVTVTRSYVGQVENGTTRCRRDFAERLDKVFGADASLAEAWDDLLRSTPYPKFFADFPLAEASAVLLRVYSATFVVGMLQTKDYAQALLTSEEALEGRLKRQQILDRTPPPRIVVVLEETVLAREVGGPEVMRAQCEHLLKMSARENITLQIAPTAYYRGISGSFNVATQATGEELLYQETSTGGITSDAPEDILHVVSAFAEMQARALSVGTSRDFIQEAVDRWTR